MNSMLDSDSADLEGPQSAADQIAQTRTKFWDQGAEYISESLSYIHNRQR